MNQLPPDDPSLEAELGQLANQLTIYDEQLRHGTRSTAADSSISEVDIDAETSSLFRCIQLLERAWPRVDPVDSTSMPARIGRFQLDCVLGIGGFGIVYKAFDPKLRRQVALKVPRLHSLSNVNLLTRFEKEARAAASLDHPNIVPIHEAGEAGSIVYIAATYCPGPNLAEWLKEQTSPIRARLAAALIAKLADAVHYSHTRGVLHFDLKPSNVLLMPLETAPPGTSADDDLPFVPRLTDFGLAKILENGPESTITQTETLVMGTPAYMAPEQTGRVDFPIGSYTDVYELGAILYELLTGRPPFVGVSVANVIDQIQKNDPISIRRIRPEIPRDLETICLKCLEKKPTRRFVTANELSKELRRYLRGEPILTRPVGILGRMQRWSRRKPTAAALVAVTLGAIVSIIGLLAAHVHNLGNFNNELGQLNQDLVTAVNEAREMQRIAVENESKTNVALYTADISRAMSAWKEGDSRNVTLLLERHIPKPGQQDLRGFEWWYLRAQSRRTHQVLLDAGSPIYVLCPSPDRKIMAVAGLDARIRLLDPSTGQILNQIPTGQIEVNGVAFSPNGDELASSGDDGTIRIWTLATGTERLKFRAHPGKAFQLFYTPNGNEIVSCGDNPVIRVFDSRSGQLRRELNQHQADINSLVPGRDGMTFASTSRDRTAVLWEFETWSRQEPFGFIYHNSLGPVAMREERDLMIIGSEGSELVSVKISKNSFVTIARNLENATSLAINPDCDLLAAGYKGGQIQLWDISSEGRLFRSKIPPWHGHEGIVYSLVWSDDGEQLISAGQDGRVLKWNRPTNDSENPLEIPIEYPFDYCAVPQTRSVLITSRKKDGPEYSKVLDWRSRNTIVPILNSGFDEITASRDGQYAAGLRRNQPQEELQVLRLPTANHAAAELSLAGQWRVPGQLANACFSPDSKSIAVSYWRRPSENDEAEHFVWLLGLPTLENKEKIPIPHAKTMAFSPDGGQILLATQTGIGLWNLHEHRLVWESIQMDLTVLAFSPDGRCVVSGGDDRLVVVRDAVDGSILTQLAGHRDKIRSVVVSPDSRTLATADDSGVVKLWSVAAGQEMLELLNFKTPANKIEFSADGRHLFLRRRRDDQYDSILIFDAGERIDANAK